MWVAESSPALELIDIIQIIPNFFAPVCWGRTHSQFNSCWTRAYFSQKAAPLVIVIVSVWIIKELNLHKEIHCKYSLLHLFLHLAVVYISSYELYLLQYKSVFVPS